MIILLLSSQTVTTGKSIPKLWNTDHVANDANVCVAPPIPSLPLVPDVPEVPPEPDEPEPPLVPEEPLIPLVP